VRASSPDDAELAAAIELLARLVGYPTVSDRSNRALIDDLAGWLDERGAATVVVESDDQGKAGLVASIGPRVEGGVVLSGHTDVVPVDGQIWTSDPFVLAERDGRLFGRGTADMKGFIAAVLAAVPRFAAAPLRRPIHLALSWDEEVGCVGAPRLIESLLAAVPRPALVVVGEPTGMRPADRHRGIATFSTSIVGRGGHSSAPHRGVNAIALAARFVGELERRAAIFADEARPGADVDAVEHATLNVGRIDGGSAVNMIAEHCRLTWECRTDSDARIAELLADLESFAAQQLRETVGPGAPEVTVRTVPDVAVPSFTAGRDSPAVALALHLTAANHCIAAPFASEAGLFETAGIPAVVLGPGMPAEAHRPDEFISREQLASCVGFLRRLTNWIA
jgi:acetylornithine deacetylase